MKSVIITGAGSGIGRHFALALLQKGYKVALAGRRNEALEETAAAAGEAQKNALVIPTDITDPAAVRSLFERAIAAFGHLDLLFNNAGVNVPEVMLEDLSYEQWRKVIDTNLTGPFLCTQEAFKVMKTQQPMGGRIINNGSISAHIPRPNSAHYTASKFGVTGLTKSTALDGRKYNIACSQIDIGNAATDMAARMTTGVPQADGSMGVEPVMHVSHVTDALMYIAELPLNANVPFITVMASFMPYAGRG